MGHVKLKVEERKSMLHNRGRLSWRILYYNTALLRDKFI